jgi:hypothetical protein
MMPRQVKRFGGRWSCCFIWGEAQFGWQALQAERRNTFLLAVSRDLLRFCCYSAAQFIGSEAVVGSLPLLKLFLCRRHMFGGVRIVAEASHFAFIV